MILADFIQFFWRVAGYGFDPLETGSDRQEKQVWIRPSREKRIQPFPNTDPDPKFLHIRIRILPLSKYGPGSDQYTQIRIRIPREKIIFIPILDVKWKFRPYSALAKNRKNTQKNLNSSKL